MFPVCFKMDDFGTVEFLLEQHFGMFSKGKEREK